MTNKYNIWLLSYRYLCVLCVSCMFLYLWIVAEPGVRVFDDQALQTIATVSHWTNTDPPISNNDEVKIEEDTMMNACNQRLQWSRITKRTALRSDPLSWTGQVTDLLWHSMFSCPSRSLISYQDRTADLNFYSAIESETFCPLLSDAWPTVTTYTVTN